MSDKKYNKMSNLFLGRNDLQRRAVFNSHTFDEVIYWDISNHCLAIKITIGGDELGIVAIGLINEKDDLFIKAGEIYKDLSEKYNKNHEFIKPDLLFKN